VYIFIQALKKINQMKKILENAIKNVITTLAGSIAGVAEIQNGVTEKNTAKIIIGIGLMILGIFSKDSD